MTSPSREYYVVLHEVPPDAKRLELLKLLRLLLPCSPGEAKKRLESLPIYFDYTLEGELAEEAYLRLEAEGAVVSGYFGGPVRSNSEFIRRRENVRFGFWRGVEADPLSMPTLAMPSFVGSVTIKNFDPRKNDLLLRIYVNRPVNEADSFHFDESALEGYKAYLSLAGVKGLRIRCEFVETERPTDGDEQEIWKR